MKRTSKSAAGRRAAPAAKSSTKARPKPAKKSAAKPRAKVVGKSIRIKGTARSARRGAEPAYGFPALAEWRIDPASGVMMVRHADIPVSRGLAASYDAAKTTSDNRKHWSNADALSADAVGNPMVRRMLVMRSRYECRNNGYLAGILSTIANYCVGTGPKLDMVSDDEPVDDSIEKTFAEWAKEIRLAEKLRIARYARSQDGEVLLVMINNPGLRSPIKLDIKLVECDRLTSPYLASKVFDDRHCDGIDYDAWGNPTAYHLLKHHPGDTFNVTANPIDSETIPARYVFHLFSPNRPEQRRGVPETAASLPLCAELRRYAGAVRAAAETAAEHAAVIYTDTVPEEEDQEAGTAWEEVELYKRGGTVLPEGWKMEQLKAEQPTSTHDSFTNTTLREIARPLNVPFTIAALDSSKANLSAAYLDFQTFSAAMTIDRGQLEQFLEWLAAAWFAEFERLPQFDGARSAAPYKHRWTWPSLGTHADPYKVANAKATKLRMGLTDLSHEFGLEGRELEKSMQNQAKALGLTIDELREVLIRSIYNIPEPLNPDAAEDDADPKTKPAKEDAQ